MLELIGATETVIEPLEGEGEKNPETQREHRREFEEQRLVRIGRRGRRLGGRDASRIRLLDVLLGQFAHGLVDALRFDREIREIEWGGNRIVVTSEGGIVELLELQPYQGGPVQGGV